MLTEILSVLKEQRNRGAYQAADLCIKNQGSIGELLPYLHQDDKILKNAVIKTFTVISEKSPETLYPYFPVFSELMFDHDQIIKWNAIDIIANLASVDEKGYFDESMVQRFLNLLEDESMITAAHSVDNLWKIAKWVKWAHLPITNQLLKIDKIKRNPECSRILTGKAIQTFSKILPEIQDKNKIFVFVEKQLQNPRAATAKKAQLFMKKHLKIT
jgi:hypothetical protein